MAVTYLTADTWSKINTKRSAWTEEMEAVKNGKIVFVPLGARKKETLRVTLYEAAKRAGVPIVVHGYAHEGVDGFAIKAREG